MHELARRIVDGDRRALARAATAIENRDPDAGQVLADLSAQTHGVLVIGVTGPPGVGKSTLVDAMCTQLRLEGKSVGVIVVDPSSPYSGGAVLGDRIRMQRHSSDPGVFIRSLATRGAAGGLAEATSGIVTLLDAAGYDVVLIETIGAGQDEVGIARVAGVTLVVLVPGLGDEVQALKAGLMEIAGVFVINKSDLPGADQLESDLQAAARQAPIVKTVATRGEGVRELLDAARSIQPLPYARPGEFAIDHIGIAVRSIEAALKFYEGAIGLHAAGRETIEHEKVRVAMLPFNSGRLELLEATEPDSAVAKFIGKRGEGLHHIAIRTPDFRATLERLKAAGARLVNEPRRGAGGHTYVFVHPASAGGVLLELIEEN